MKYFIRSLRYLRPYRGRIAVAVLCVIFIACLWGGGLGLMLPGAKILLAEEGLHGWAYLTASSDRLGGKLVQQKTPAGTAMRGLGGERVEIESVLNIVSVDEDGPGGRAGLSASDWIIGLADGEPNHVRMRADVLAGVLADAPAGRQLDLSVLRQGAAAARSIQVTMGEARLASRALLRIAKAIPDPGSTFSGRFPIFVGLLAIVLVATFLRAFFTFCQEYLVGTAIWQGIMDLRCDNYNVVLHLPTTYFSEKGVSDSMSRFIQDTGELARGQNTLFGKTMVEPAKALGSLAIALWCSWELTLMAMVAGPPALYLIRRLGKSMHKASGRALESWSSMLAVLGETLTGIRVVKAYTMEGAERRRFFRVNRRLLKQQNKMQRLNAATGPAVESLGIFAGMVAAAVAGYLVFNLQMSSFVFVTWLVALFALFDPVRKLAKVSMRFQAADAAARRIFELQDTPMEKQLPGAPSLGRHRESLEFRDVSFRYPSATEDALSQIDLSVPAGRTLAIVGPNGSGKTTLVSLVPRLIDPAAGTVLIDGKDISKFSVRSLRRQIGLVTQDTVIFNATVRENISYGLRRPKDADVLAAAKKAFVDEFTTRLPEGYDTVVGEHGATLSGGQRQRIAIARAILRDPAILIFDEATSQVDSESEKRIQEAMAEFIKGRTTLMIAHRLATIRWADRIAVMDDGRIIDTGTHEELLKRCSLYQHLYRTQFLEGELEG